MTCFIFAAGSFYGLVERPAAGDLVIAADAGYKNCLACGVMPDIIVGDFDSMPAPDVPGVITLPVEKDDTDSLHAMRIGLEKGYTDFVLYGGTGGSRVDHTIANIQCLLFLVSRGARGRMYGDGVIYRVIHDERISFPSSCQGTLSLFCMDGQARGVSISGMKYSLDNYTVSSCFPIGVSNSFTGSPAEVEVMDGTLLIISDIQGDEIEQI